MICVVPGVGCSCPPLCIIQPAFNGGSYTLVLCSTSGIEESNAQNVISLYPNPAENSIQIEYTQTNGIENYFIYDAFGKIVQQGVLLSGNEKIDISNLPKGIFILSVNNNVSKFIKE